VVAACCCCCCLLLLYDCAHIEAQLICSGVLFKSDPRPVSQLQASTVGRQFEPERNCGDCLKLMQSMVWCVTYKLVAAVLERVVKGARFGCHHCQGVIVHCYSIGAGCCVEMRRDPLRWRAQVQRKAAGAVTACSAICNIMVQEKLRGITLQRLCSIGRLLHSTVAAASTTN